MYATGYLRASGDGGIEFHYSFRFSFMLFNDRTPGTDIFCISSVPFHLESIQVRLEHSFTINVKPTDELILTVEAFTQLSHVRTP